MGNLQNHINMYSENNKFQRKPLTSKIKTYNDNYFD